MADEVTPTPASNKTDKLRSLVRPVTTWLLVVAAVGLAVLLVLKWSDADMAKQALAAILALTGIAVGFWFGSRKS